MTKVFFPFLIGKVNVFLWQKIFGFILQHPCTNVSQLLCSIMCHLMPFRDLFIHGMYVIINNRYNKSIIKTYIFVSRVWEYANDLNRTIWWWQYSLIFFNWLFFYIFSKSIKDVYVKLTLFIDIQFICNYFFCLLRKFSIKLVVMVP